VANVERGELESFRDCARLLRNVDRHHLKTDNAFEIGRIAGIQR